MNSGISDSLRADLEAIATSKTDDFVELTKRSGLNPSKDFIGADLRGADLRNQDLTEFDLTGADITGALIEGAKFNPERSPSTYKSKEDHEGPIIERMWHQTNDTGQSETIPDDCRKLMNDIRSEGSHADAGKYERLVTLSTGYRRRTSLIDRFLRRSKTLVAVPYWLRDFLLERYSVSSHRFAKDFIQHLADEGLIQSFTEREKLMKLAIWGEYDHSRGEAVAKLCEKYGGDDEVYNFVADLAVNDRSYLVRRDAIKNLVPNEQRLDHYKDLAMDVFRNDTDVGVKGAAVGALRYLRKIDTDVWLLMFEIAADLDQSNSRGEAILSLELEVGNNPDIDQVIVQLLHKSVTGPADQGMLSAISVLGRLTKGNDAAGDYFLRQFKEAKRDIARYWLFAILERHFSDSQFVSDAIQIDLADESSYLCRDLVVKHIVADVKLTNQYFERLAKKEAQHPFDQVRRVAQMAVVNGPWEPHLKAAFMVDCFKNEENKFNRQVLADRLARDFSDLGQTRDFFLNLDERETKDIQFADDAQKLIEKLMSS